MNFGDPGQPKHQRVPIGTVLNGIYTVDKLIAIGGMGEVYRGHNAQTGEEVAIKMILPDFAQNDTAFALFRKEASVLNALYHEAIVRYYVFTIEQELGQPYLAMEFVDGISLADRLETCRLDFEEARVLQRRLAEGLQKAHDLGVIHRDISPDNIILPGGDVARAKIIDFGIARAADIGGKTIIGDGFAGKHNFVSPEQLGLYGGDVQATSDIYSLGLVLASALKGSYIDMGGTQVEVIEKRREVPDLSDIDARFIPLLSKMLQPKPEDRPKSMTEVVDWPFSGKKGRGGSGNQGSGGIGLFPVVAVLLLLALGGGGASFFYFDLDRFIGGGRTTDDDGPKPDIPTTSSGAPTTSSGTPTTSSGAPTTSTGGTTTSTGGPTTSSGTPTTSSGTPTTSTGGTTTSGGQPTTSSGTPTTSSGTPTTSSGTPTTSSGTPTTSSGQPTTSSGTPTTSSGGTTTQPQPDPREVERIRRLVEQRNNRYSGPGGDVRRYVETFDGGDCTLAQAMTATDNSANIVIFGNDVQPAQDLITNINNRFGFDPDGEFREVRAAQCPALQFAHAAQQTGQFDLTVNFDTDEIRNQSAVVGRVQGARGQTVQMLLVSTDGQVFDITEMLDTRQGQPTLRLKINIPGLSVAAPSLLVALATDGPPIVSAAGGPVPASQLFDKLEDAVVAIDNPTRVGLNYFLVTP